MNARMNDSTLSIDFHQKKDKYEWPIFMLTGSVSLSAQHLQQGYRIPPVSHGHDIGILCIQAAKKLPTSF